MISRVSKTISMLRSLIFSTVVFASCQLMASEENKVIAEYSPYSGYEYPRNVYWGDTHCSGLIEPDTFLHISGTCYFNGSATAVQAPFMYIGERRPRARLTLNR